MESKFTKIIIDTNDRFIGYTDKYRLSMCKYKPDYISFDISAVGFEIVDCTVNTKDFDKAKLIALEIIKLLADGI